ncbi:MAG: hypothetical protein GXO78_14320 [Calditrichaeota bacterium]|nr:hypothetical protein [Calditrichota bacterium]
MGKMSVIILFAGWLATLQASRPLPVADQVLLHRYTILSQVKANVQQELEQRESADGKKKSIPRAVMLSAVLPGAGQFYAGSYVKSILFLTVEVAAWVINVRYNRLGDKKDAEFRAFADKYWDERRYWSYLYYRLLEDGVELPFSFERKLENKEKYWYLIVEEQYPEARRLLRDYENVLPGFTHRLPEKSEDPQQYYEMIGKYPGQFGNAWADASFLVEYSGYEGRVTPLNEKYVQMRNESNRYFDIAGYGAMVALVNHVISAIDAGFTTRNLNRKQQVKLSYKNIYYPGEYVNMLGLQMEF